MRRIFHPGVLSTALLFLPLICAPAGAAETGAKKIPPQELAQMLAGEKKPLLINNMGLIECLDHSIAGSVCIPSEEFEKRIGALPPEKDRRMVFYCESDTSQKSCEASDVAVRHGYTAVYVLDGGMPAWKRAGYATVAEERIPRRAIASVKPPALRRMLAEKAEVLPVDIRSENVFRKGHIEGAINLPMYQLHRRWRELPLDRPLVLVDNRGFRSLLAASYLAARGYAVKPLFGGMTAWETMLDREKKTAKRK
jgi:rhodanese-related sulfurtransferase